MLQRSPEFTPDMGGASQLLEYSPMPIYAFLVGTRSSRKTPMKVRLFFAVVVAVALTAAGCNSENDPIGFANDRIAFDSDRDGNFDVYVMDADGSNQTRLTNNPAQDRVPAWSPDE